MTAISACMITFNNERTVEKALKSVAAWASEVIVVDSFSTDATPQIARRYATSFEQRAWPGFRDQYNYCVAKARNDWVVFLDADEEISPALAAEMARRIEGDGGRFDGYIAHRRNFYLGRWIMHGGWVPDCEIRLFRKSKGGFEGGLHANVKVSGAVGELRHFYHHYNYRDIGDQIDTISRYSRPLPRTCWPRGGGSRTSTSCSGPQSGSSRSTCSSGGSWTACPGWSSPSRPCTMCLQNTPGSGS